jgi:hypothetical protein
MEQKNEWTCPKCSHCTKMKFSLCENCASQPDELTRAIMVSLDKIMIAMNHNFDDLCFMHGPISSLSIVVDNYKNKKYSYKVFKHIMTKFYINVIRKFNEKMNRQSTYKNANNDSDHFNDHDHYTYQLNIIKHIIKQNTKKNSGVNFVSNDKLIEQFAMDELAKFSINFDFDLTKL